MKGVAAKTASAASVMTLSSGDLNAILVSGSNLLSESLQISDKQFIDSMAQLAATRPRRGIGSGLNKRIRWSADSGEVIAGQEYLPSSKPNNSNRGKEDESSSPSSKLDKDAANKLDSLLDSMLDTDSNTKTPSYEQPKWAGIEQQGNTEAISGEEEEEEDDGFSLFASTKPKSKTTSSSSSSTSSIAKKPKKKSKYKNLQF